MEDRQSRSKPTQAQLSRIISVAKAAALRSGANQFEADEVAQSTVVRFWIRWNTAVIAEARRRTDARWDGYVRRSAINVYRDRIREHQRRLHRQRLASEYDPTVSRRPDTSALTRVCPCPIEALMVRTLIAEEIEALPTLKQRQVARAAFLRRLSTAEIAAELGIQPQAVRKHLRPAREQLIKRIEENQ